MLNAWLSVSTPSCHHTCFHHVFEAQVARTPQAPALVFQNHSLTYRDLDRRANQLAQRLRTLGVGPEVCVAVCMERSLELIVSLLGILKAGGVYVPLDPAYPSDRLQYMLADTQAPVLLTQPQLLESEGTHLPTLDLSEVQILTLDAAWTTIAQECDTAPSCATTGDELAYIIYTSGSTGQPKGVLVPHRGLGNVVDAQIDLFALGSQSRVLQFSSISFDASVFEIVMALGTGACLVLAPRAALLPGPDLAGFLRDAAITHLTIPPSSLAALPSCELPALATVIVAGEACSSALVARWALGRCFFNAYGPSETTIWATTACCDAQDGAPSIGREISQTQCYILDEQMQSVSVGEAGELYIAGIGVARGYRNRPELTAERFVPNPFSPTTYGDRLYKTGDLARYRLDGQIEFIGRVDEQVKIRGFRIEPSEISAVLQQHPSVRESLVIAREDAPLAGGYANKRLVAYVVPQTAAGDATADLAATLRAFLSERLPAYMVPSAFVLLDTLPLTPNGKVDRKALPAPDFTRDDATEFVAPRTLAEAVLAEIWAEVLGVSVIGVHDNFFALGGHSLLAGQVLVRLHEIFPNQVSMHLLFEQPTIAQFVAAMIERADETSIEYQARVYLDRKTFSCELHETSGIPALNLAVPRPASGQMPLSFAQQRLWLIDRLDPGNLSYLVPQTVRLTGPLNIAALAQSFNDLVARHEALRTVFRPLARKAVQVVLPTLRIPLPLVDLEALDPAEQELGVQKLAAMEAQRPFDLAHGPLLRTTLLRLHEESHVLLLTLHHIVIDDWSLSIFWRELAAFYRANLTGQAAPLAALPIQYPDAALWQHEWLSGVVLHEQVGYWQHQLRGCTAVLHLPTDRPRPAKQTFNGARETIVLPKSLTRALVELSQQESVTLFMTLLATFQVLLQRYSGQRDFVVGTPLANRRRREFEDLIGFFVNTLALRADVAPELTFRELLGRVRNTALGALEHQDLPFDQVVELVQPERDPSHNPLFQVMFALQNAPREALQLDGLTAEVNQSTGLTSQFDLFLEMVQVQDWLLTSFEYNTDLFDAATITRMLAHFQTLLESVVEHPNRVVAQLAMLPAQEQEQLAAWNATQVAYPAHQRMHDLFEAQVARTPQAVAVVFEDQHLTYQELNRRANQLAHHLRTLGVGPEALVGICVERSLDLIVGLMGILKAGGAYVPLDPSYPKARLALTLADAQASVVLTQQSLRAELPSCQAQIVCLDTDWPEIAHQPTYNLVTAVAPSNLAYLIYTSGSTGRPKGVAITHASAVTFLHWAHDSFSAAEFAGMLGSTSICFDLSVFEIFGSLSWGGTLILVENILYLHEQAAYHPVTLINTVPSAIAQLVRHGQIPASVRTINLAGEALAPSLVQELYHVPTIMRVCNLYGPSEDTTYSTWTPLAKGPTVEVTIGRPLPNTEVYLLDATFQPVPIGIPGELYLGGDGLARGYLNRPELTAEKFVPDPFSGRNGARLYRTGDLARYRADGQIDFLGRIDHQVKVRGYRIELGEIETVIAEHPGVQETIVLAREDLPGEKQLVAYVVPNPHYEITDEQLAESQAEYIADWQQLYDATHRDAETETDGTFDLTGWNSSYTGTPIAAEEMQEQVEQVVARVLAHKPQRVLEIGCGTGLLLFRIAPHCTHYCGTDFSATVLQQVATQVQQRNLPQVRLLQRVADNLADLDSEPFDVVLINSVVQYFPSADYLQHVLAQAIQYVRPGGCIMVGDLRSYPLLEAYHTSVQLYQATPSTSSGQLRQRIERRVAGEEELLIDPTFFRALQQAEPRISQVEVQLRRGQYENELTKFRYDALLHIERDVTTVMAQRLDWQRDGLTLARLREILTTDAPAVLQVNDVPNARLGRDVAALRLLAREDRPATVRDLTELVDAAAGLRIDPEVLWTLGAELGYTTEVNWSDQDLGRVQVTFRQTPVTYGINEQSALRVQPWHAYANNPVYSKLKRKLVPQVRAGLAKKVPEYMVPSAFVVLDAMPLTPNGKVDRKALPAPNGVQTEDAQTFVAPRTPLETQLAVLWAELFGVERVSVNDHFFAVGGHSLLAIRLAAQIKATFGVELTMRDLFAAPTLAGCAQAIERVQQASLGGATTSDPVVDLIADTALDLTIRPHVSDDWYTAAPQGLFLTGATGFLGAFLLAELLTQTTAEIYCLVRAKTTAQGKARLQATLTQYGLWNAAMSGRIVPVLGDLSQPRLGLSETDFAAVASKVDAIYHSGAMVSFLYPYAALKSANVLGTQEVIRLACHGTMKPLHYVSTIAVAMTAQASADGRISEQMELGPIDSVDSGYVQTKWVAEHLLLAAKERGLPVSIYRPGRITGQSATGASNPDDLVSRLLVGWLQLGSAPAITMQENFAPVDYVAQTIVHLSLQQDALGEVYHVLNPQWSDFGMLAQALRDLGYPITIRPYNEWYAELYATVQNEQDNVLYPLLSFLSAMPTEEAWVNHLSMPQFDCQNTLDGLANSSIACPMFDAAHIEATVAYLVEHGIAHLDGRPLTERVAEPVA